MSNVFFASKLKSAAAVVVALVALSSATYFVALPMYNSRVVKQGLDAYAGRGVEQSTEVQKLQHLARPEQLARSIELLGKPDQDSDTQRVAALRAVISEASREKAGLAMLLGGIAIRDGHAGPVDTAAALKLFEEVANVIEPMARAGAPEALYLQAWMLGEGLGAPRNQASALALMKHAAPALRGALLVRAVDQSTYGTGPFSGVQDAQRTITLAKQAIGEGNIHAYIVAKMGCNEGTGDGLTEDQALALYQKRRECQAAVARTAENAKMPIGILDYGVAQLELQGDIAGAAERFSRVGINPVGEQALIAGLVKATVAPDTDAFIKAMRGLQEELDAASRKQPMPDPEFQIGKIIYTFNKWTATRPPLNQRINFATALALMGRMHPAYEMKIRLVYDTPGWMQVLDDLDDVKEVGTLDTLLAEVRRSVALEVVRGTADAGLHESAPRPSTPLQTGYIGKSPSEDEGFSTFHVDNTGSGADATVRLYRVGDTKAVRSFSIRRGDQFTARGLAPSDYKMRYRYKGSETTYEAIETFALREERIDGGKRFSKMEVTLYRVKNGNMRTVEVAPETF